jgi:hypothetical protein
LGFDIFVIILVLREQNDHIVISAPGQLRRDPLHRFPPRVIIVKAQHDFADMRIVLQHSEQSVVDHRAEGA